MAVWKTVGENLVRHSAGGIYLRARVDGKPIRVSLGTSDIRIAKIKKDSRLDALRSDAKSKNLHALENSPKTIGDFLKIVEQQTILPHLKITTVKHYQFTFWTLSQSLNISQKAQSFSSLDASAWWKKYAIIRCAQSVNLGLTLVKRIGAVIVAKGLTSENPFAHLKRIALPRKFLNVPSSAQIIEIMENIRSQNLPYSIESANFVGFLAYSGLRISEANQVIWKDVDESWITVTGGEALTKNRRFRKVPISQPIKEILDSMRTKNITPATSLFSILTPRIALRAACRRLKIPHIHPHLLRHYFATWAIQSGVDVPTVSKWLGHLDGGTLALKTYGHVRDDHGLQQSKKLI